MRLPDDHLSARVARLAAALIPALALVACGAGSGASRNLAAPVSHEYGPRGDYPVVVGYPYSVAGVTYTPEDVLNYDEVGFVAADPAGAGVTGSHHTLPLPSYVEVTSLETGRTIVVRLERRGPMDGHELIALSPGALEQLAASAGTPVRVRRVNPPEDQRELLRLGHEAAPRLDTPMTLVEVLKRKLPTAQAQIAHSTTEGVVAQPAPATSPPPGSAVGAERTNEAPALPPLQTVGHSEVAQPQQAQQSGAFVVQAAAFSTAERAERAARTLNGEVTRAGRYFRVRTGPFATHGEAEASLAKVRAAGYSDARILTNG